MARELEAHGIATVCLSIALQVTQKVRPPRALYLRFPYGHPLGEPHRTAQQMSILRRSLAMLIDASEGEIREPGDRWRFTRYEGEST